jgi:hypothetical protein
MRLAPPPRATVLSVGVSQTTSPSQTQPKPILGASPLLIGGTGAHPSPPPSSSSATRSSTGSLTRKARASDGTSRSMSPNVPPPTLQIEMQSSPSSPLISANIPPLPSSGSTGLLSSRQFVRSSSGLGQDGTIPESLRPISTSGASQSTNSVTSAPLPPPPEPPLAPAPPLPDHPPPVIEEALPPALPPSPPPAAVIAPIAAIAAAVAAGDVPPPLHPYTPSSPRGAAPLALAMAHRDDDDDFMNVATRAPAESVAAAVPSMHVALAPPPVSIPEPIHHSKLIQLQNDDGDNDIEQEDAEAAAVANAMAAGSSRGLQHQQVVITVTASASNDDGWDTSVPISSGNNSNRNSGAAGGMVPASSPPSAAQSTANSPPSSTSVPTTPYTSRSQAGSDSQTSAAQSSVTSAYVTPDITMTNQRSPLSPLVSPSKQLPPTTSSLLTFDAATPLSASATMAYNLENKSVIERVRLSASNRPRTARELKIDQINLWYLRRKHLVSPYLQGFVFVLLLILQSSTPTAVMLTDSSLQDKVILTLEC